ERYPGICTAAAVLLKNRNKGMSLVPYALLRLNKLDVTMSPKSINKALDLLGEDFDLPIKNWKGDITAQKHAR
ncbi:unnamed protein product, partial [Porites evermanni]